jgi:hypothetical protein
VDPAISGRNIVFGAAPTGVYMWSDGELRVIANLDSTYPGSGNPLGFDAASSPSVSGENVSFYCHNGRPGPAAAIAFWKERGVIETRRRRNLVDDGFFFEDAMIEFHALAENG